jgi:hypothetical protein
MRIVPKDILDNVQKLQELLQQFNENDMNFVTNAIKQYNESLKDKSLAINDDIIRNYGTKLNQFHVSLVDHITGPNSMLSEQDKNEKFKESMKNVNQLLDVQLPEVIAGKTKEIKTGIESLSVMKSYPELQNTTNSIINNIYKLKARNYFFEYKYVQMNVLLLVAMQNMYTTMIKGIDEVVTEHKRQIALRNSDLQDVLKKLNLLMTAEPVQVNISDIDKITGMVKNLQGSMAKDNQVLSDKLLSVSRQVVTSPASVQNPPQPPAQSSTPAQPTRGGSSKVRKGGFVRSHSTFPAQEFVELS